MATGWEPQWLHTHPGAVGPCVAASCTWCHPPLGLDEPWIDRALNKALWRSVRVVDKPRIRVKAGRQVVRAVT